MRAHTLNAPVREPLLNRAGELARKWRAEFFDFLVRQFGIWKPVDYLAANFSWTVGEADQITFAYCLMGKRLEVALVLRTTASGAVASVTVAIPADLVAGREMTSCVVVDDNGTLVPGKARVSAGGTTVAITRLDGAAFTDLVAVEGLIVFEVQ